MQSLPKGTRIGAKVSSKPSGGVVHQGTVANIQGHMLAVMWDGGQQTWIAANEVVVHPGSGGAGCSSALALVAIVASLASLAQAAIGGQSVSHEQLGVFIGVAFVTALLGLGLRQSKLSWVGLVFALFSVLSFLMV